MRRIRCVESGPEYNWNPLLAQRGMDYAQILPELFVGSRPRDADDIDRLRGEADVTAVLDLQMDDDMPASLSVRSAGHKVL